MTFRQSLFPLWLTAVTSWLAPPAQAQSLEVSAEQMVRLGIELERPEPVEAMTIAAAPAEIVVPPSRQAVASAPVDGLLARLLVAPGDPVARGDLVAELESPELLEWQREFLDANIEAELATLQLERDRSLVADGIVAERRLEEAEARSRAALARVRQTREQLRIAGIGADAIAALAGTGRLTSRLELRAAIDGVVTAGYADPGARVAAFDPILAIADISQVWAEMHLRVEDAARVEHGMRILLRVGSHEILAPITAIGQVVEPETQTILVRAELGDAGGRLKAGQFVAAQIVTAGGEGAGFRLPVTALVRQGEAPYVFVRRSGAFEPVPVRPVYEDDRSVLIAAGVDAASEVAVSGTSTLKSIWLAALEGESE